MRPWVAAQIGHAASVPAGAVVILDAESVLADADVEDLRQEMDVIPITDWIELRRVWDLDIRHRSERARTALLIRAEDFAGPSDLPWDIEREAAAVARVRWPVPIELRPLFRVAGEQADALAGAARSNAPANEIVAIAYGVRPGASADELDAVARLRLDPSTPPELWDALTQTLMTSLARQVADDRGDPSSLQAAWNDWLRAGDASPSASALRAAPGPVLSLLGSGVLMPAPAVAKGLPDWTRIGAAEPDPNDLIEQLVAAKPPEPSTAHDWIETASWWGQVRAAVASQPIPPRLSEPAWEIWQDLDTKFGAWLRESYGSSLLSAAPTPRAVHQIAPFLARRVADGARVLLVVLDGLGFAQWHQLRAATPLKILQATGCLAMIPTLTGVSRQAILAGALPVDFPDTLTSTRLEDRRWRAFWTEHGLREQDVTYSKTLGSDASNVPTLGGRVAAVVVTAVDELLHGAEVLADRQVAVDVGLWAKAGFLEALVEAGVRAGFEVWLTADHGNLPTLPGPVPSEGQLVESAGTRVRLYPNETLRAAAAEYGTIWDPPGFPADVPLRPLFAPGRRGFHTSGAQVSHGGLSLDEVVIPFVQVSI
jgi:hypothetical protein